MTPEQIANALGGAIRIPDESCKLIFPVAFYLGHAEAAKGPDSKAGFPANFSKWSTDRQLAWHSGFQAGMQEWPDAASNEGDTP